MNLDDLPDYLAADDLEPFGITPEDVRRRCPGAVEYGSANAPYWHREDLAPLFGPEGGEPC
jgi:hypothetical protein